VAEREGVRRWLGQAGRCEEYAEYLRELAVNRAFAVLVDAARQRLAALYAEPLAAAEKRVRKRALFERLRADYARESADWPPQYRYDRWMSAPLDNARLATVANYEQRVPALEAMLTAQGGDLRAFYAAAAELARLTGGEREARLDGLTLAGPQAWPAPAGSARDAGRSCES
jgi:predicted aminopeptidase